MIIKCLFVQLIDRLKISNVKKIELKKNIYLIDNFWPSEKCDDIILQSEKIGYQAATIQTENGPRLVDFVRNNNRVIRRF